MREGHAVGRKLEHGVAHIVDRGRSAVSQGDERPRPGPIHEAPILKLRKIKKRLRPDQRLEIDGGINAQTIRAARDAGADWFVVASAIFDHPNRAEAVAELRQELKQQ